MAKRKSKKNQKKLIFTCVEIILAIVVLIMLFLPAAGLKDSDTTYTGLQLVFGYTEKGTFILIPYEIEIFKFSIGAFIPYLLILITLVGVIITYAIKVKTQMINGLFALLFLVSGILLLLILNFVILGDNLSSLQSILGITSKDNFELAIGSIIAAVVAFLGCAVSLGDAIINK